MDLINGKRSTAVAERADHTEMGIMGVERWRAKGRCSWGFEYCCIVLLPGQHFLFTFAAGCIV